MVERLAVHRFQRRQVLRSLGLGACGAALGCATRGRLPVAETPRLARVRVAPERIIRTVVGLRPFRPAGFVVRADKLDGKLVVHNYGHGGAGVSLSWGTAHLAVEEAAAAGHSRYAVLGCGAVGLATARLLQRRGGEVVMYARELPPGTTSNVAGAHWGTFAVADPLARTPAFDAQFLRAARLSHRAFQDLVGERYGVRWIETYALSDNPYVRSSDALSAELDRFELDYRTLGRRQHPFAAPFVDRFVTMMIEPAVYLDAVLRDFLLAGGKLVVRELSDRRGVLGLPEPVIVNCTGLGSRALFGDQELVPIKGQMTVLVPQPEVDYALLAYGHLYMFPRRDGILLGGSFDRGDWSLDPDPEDSERILSGHVDVFRTMR